MVTILISFIERDEPYIQEKVDYYLTKYPVILWDDRKDKSKKLDFNCKCLNSEGEPIGPYQARRELVKEVETDFLWFVDSDDDALIENVIVDLQYDIESFNAKKFTEYEETSLFTLNKSYSTLYPLKKGYYDSYSLWNKIFRTEFVRDCMKLLPDKKNLFCDEDFILESVLFENACTYGHHVEFIYNYYAFKGRYNLEDYTGKLDLFKSLLIGIKDSIDIRMSTLKDETFKKDTWSFSIENMLNKADKSSVEDRPKMYDAVKEAVGEEYWKKYALENKFSILQTQYFYRDTTPVEYEGKLYYQYPDIIDENTVEWRYVEC